MLISLSVAPHQVSILLAYSNRFFYISLFLRVALRREDWAQHAVGQRPDGCWIRMACIRTRRQSLQVAVSERYDQQGRLLRTQSEVSTYRVVGATPSRNCATNAVVRITGSAGGAHDIQITGYHIKASGLFLNVCVRLWTHDTRCSSLPTQIASVSLLAALSTASSSGALF